MNSWVPRLGPAPAQILQLGHRQQTSPAPPRSRRRQRGLSLLAGPQSDRGRAVGEWT